MPRWRVDNRVDYVGKRLQHLGSVEADGRAQAPATKQYRGDQATRHAPGTPQEDEIGVGGFASADGSRFEAALPQATLQCIRPCIRFPGAPLARGLASIPAYFISATTMRWVDERRREAMLFRPLPLSASDAKIRRLRLSAQVGIDQTTGDPHTPAAIDLAGPSTGRANEPSLEPARLQTSGEMLRHGQIASMTDT